MWKAGSAPRALRRLHTAVRGWREGDEAHNFTVARVQEVAEMHLKAVHLQHSSGAEHLHISRQDSDNVFAVALRTTPLNSSGVPHVLEHVSLCGSKNFPVRDPFFKMLTRSLSTFMNAFTANDWTMYPFSTQNRTDFSNLMAVYLDAVFQPLLRKHDFLQEGWRLEHTSDPASQLALKGVVYNEMKGVFSDPHQVFCEAALNHLHPSGTYSFVSGGHPSHIPSLSCQQLRHFHAQHYHPANARFFTYGNLPLEQHLHTIDSYLALLKLPPHQSTSVPPQPRWTSPRRSTIHGPPDPLSPDPLSSSILSNNYLLSDVTSAQECFELSILSSLLTQGPHSPFYRGLIETGLGAEYSPGTGYSDQARDTSFSVGLQRVHRDKVEEVLEAMEGVVERVVEEGFRQEQVSAILHRIELSLKHQGDQFGLKLLLSIIPSWNHGADPTQLLQVTAFVDELKGRLGKQASYLQDLTSKHLLLNPHKLTLVSHAQPLYLAEQQKNEEAMLTGMVALLTPERREEIVQEAGELSAMQAAVESLECLPSLRVEEVSGEHERVPLARHQGAGMAVYQCAQPTNGVTYVRMLLDASHLPSHLAPFLPLFSCLLTSMGTSRMDFRQQSEEMDLVSDGLHASPLLCAHPSRPDLFQSALLLSSHCLDRNLSAMMGLWSDIFVALSLSDLERFSVLLSSLATDSAAALNQQGHRYAMLRASSTLSGLSQLQEEVEGVSQMAAVKKMLCTPREELVAIMKELSQLLLSPSRLMRSSVHCQPASFEPALEALSGLCAGMGGGSGKGGVKEDVVWSKRPHEASFLDSHLHVPSQVNHLGRAFRTVPVCHPDQAPLKLLASLLSSKFLHTEIREKGGAYGGGCVASANNFHFFSYRDPNLSSTLTAFDAAVQWACDGSFKDTHLTESKLAVFSSVDKPVPPGSQALRSFVQCVSEEEWHALRQALLAANKDELVRVARKYLKASSCTALIGAPNQAHSLHWLQCPHL